MKYQNSQGLGSVIVAHGIERIHCSNVATPATKNVHKIEFLTTSYFDTSMLLAIFGYPRWFERSGFRALSLLENASNWKAATSIAEKIASFGGPRAEEAATRPRQLRLKHHIWED